MAESPSDDSPAPSDDPKERYRQALEQKKQRGGYGSAGSSASDGSAKGSSAKAGGKREFRRKSG
jgi:membrane-associated protein